MEIDFFVPMFWWYIPALVTLSIGVFYIVLENSQDRSGAGMIGFFLMFPSITVVLISWLLYFIAATFFGIR